MSRQRIAMAIEFDGKAFHGWQRQKNAASVQASLEDALAQVEGCEVETAAAGRTDTGVHGEALLVHTDVSTDRWMRSPRAYTQGVNRLLCDQVRVTGVRAVSPDFHARFDCLERRYRYEIWNRSTPSAIHNWRHWWMPRTLDLQAMQQAAACFIGEHDFTSFRAAGCQAASAVRNLRHVEVYRDGWRVMIEVRADAFLYHMVRNIVGTLARIGTGDWPPEMVNELLALKDRTRAAATAPAHGLYFSDAIYEGFSARDLIGCEG